MALCRKTSRILGADEYVQIWSTEVTLYTRCFLVRSCIVLRMHCPLNISRIHLLCCSLMKNHSIARLRQEPRAFRPGVCRSESRTGSLHQRFRSRFEGVYVSFQEVGVFVWRITSQFVLWKQRVAQLPLAATGCGLEALQLYKHTPLKSPEPRSPNTHHMKPIQLWMKHQQVRIKLWCRD